MHINRSKQIHPLRAVREDRGLTTQEVAEAVGVTRAAVSAWEKSAYFPRPQQAIKLCELFPSLSLNALYGKAA